MIPMPMPHQNEISKYLAGHAEAVGAGGHESRLAEVQQAGETELHVEADRGDREVHRVDADERLDGVFEDRCPVHTDPFVNPLVRLDPGCPAAASRSTRIKIAKAGVFFSSLGTTNVASSTRMPDDEATDEGTERRSRGRRA